MRASRRTVLGVPVDPIRTEDVLRCVRDAVQERRTVQIATVNAEYVIRALRDEDFRRVLCAATVCTPDGAGVVWALRRNGVDIRRRVGGSDLVWQISEQAAALGHRVFLLGAGPGIAAEAAVRLQAAYPGLGIAGTFEGSPSATEEAAIVDLIRRSRADILFVAFGAPAQDLWLGRNLMRAGVYCGMGVGGSLDYVAGAARRAPVWMQDHGLDWLWRLIRQPWRWKRMLALPRFAYLVLREPRGQSDGRTMNDE
jgi:N-acetylglucosaminyldiphosphoundecaprenol N-acetyl-beta-D-mannosaminyltransferase